MINRKQSVDVNDLLRIHKFNNPEISQDAFNQNLTDNKRMTKKIKVKKKIKVEKDKINARQIGGGR